MISRRIRTVLFAFAGLLLLTGAKPRKIYEREVDANTEHVLVYKGMATALNLRATLLSPSFRRTMAAERERLLAPSPADQAEFVARMERDGAGYHDVVLVADSALPDGERFGVDDSRWQLRLWVGTREAELVSVEHIRRPTPLHRGLYPHLNQWTELWIARFAKNAEDSGPVRLQVGSGYGNGEARFTP